MRKKCVTVNLYGSPDVVRADPPNPPKLSGAAEVEVVVVWDAPPKENPVPNDVVVEVIAVIKKNDA